MRIIKFVLCLLFGLLFINAGLNKFLMYMPEPELEPELLKINEAINQVKWIIPLTGLFEIIGGLLFIFPKTRALGAIVIFPIMIGILVHNYVFMPQGLMIGVPLFLINLYIILDNREKYQHLIS